MTYNARVYGLLVAACLFAGAGAACGDDDPAAISQSNGRWVDKNGYPTFKIAPDGTVDWPTFSGYLRYHSECHVCHGPDGEGSSYAPALKNSLKTLDYPHFLSIVAAGKQDVNNAQNLVMPAFGENKNVVCYLDNIYTYLRARADGALPRGRPQKHEPKPDWAKKDENECMG